MLFQKIEQTKTKVAYVAEQLMNAIRRGEYQIGDKLPSERFIAEQMNVSRNSVREAMSALQISQIVETKVGDGTYVKNLPKSKADIEKALSLAKDSADLLEIWEARKEIEITLIKLAIKRATSKGLDIITDHLATMRDAVRTQDTKGYLAANERFHLAIADSAQNLPLRNALGALHNFTNKELLDDVNRAYVVAGMEKSLKEHEDILEAICNGDEEAGIKSIEAHFRELESYFESKYL